MKTLMTASLALLMMAAPAPLALADDDTDGYRRASGGERSMTLPRAEAERIARAEGMARVLEVERDDGHWEMEGCTRDGFEIEIDIHGATGEILEREIDDDGDDC